MRRSDFDMTGKIRTTDPIEVHAEVVRLFRGLYPHGNSHPVTLAFEDMSNKNITYAAAAGNAPKRGRLRRTPANTLLRDLRACPENQAVRRPAPPQRPIGRSPPAWMARS
jgi:hypothetical protein